MMKYFDEFARQFKAGGDNRDVVERLVRCLDTVRATQQPEWPAMARACREGELHTLLLEDPYTRRAFAKPRGYAGDAATLDFVYGHRDIQDAVVQSSEIGRTIFAYTGGASLPAQAVRWRRARIAHEIEAVSTKHMRARVLAFACGHLREIEFVDPQIRGRIRITATDMDEEALRLVANAYAQDAEIERQRLSVRDLIAGRQAFECRFDLVYSLGLFDYLSDKVARRLIGILLSLAAPGGKVVIANFTTETKGAGYMEAAMDWWLHYRSADTLAQWAILPGRNAIAEVFEDPFAQVAYLVLRQP